MFLETINKLLHFRHKSQGLSYSIIISELVLIKIKMYVSFFVWLLGVNKNIKSEVLPFISTPSYTD